MACAQPRRQHCEAIRGETQVFSRAVVNRAALTNSEFGKEEEQL